MMINKKLNGDLMKLLKDDPINSKNFLTSGMKDLTSQMVEFLKAEEANYPILVSGDWGAGKTSVLKSIQNEIDGMGGCYPTIFFEAWHYEKADGLLPALMRKIWQKTPSNQREEVKTLAESICKSAFYATTSALPMVLKAIGIPLLPELLKILNPEDMDTGIKSIRGSENKPPPMDVGDKLRQDLNIMVKKTWGENKFPIVFIDDLDRCSPEGTVSLLDAIRMLVADKVALQCKFVVALDRSIAVRAISTKFEGIRNFDGNRYLEKIFPLAFHVPSLTTDESADLLEKLLEQLPDGKDDTFGNRKDALAETLTNPSFANPRLMKRSINKFLMVCRYESKQQTKAKENVESDKALAKWITASERWPRLRHLVQQRDEMYWDLMHDALKRNNPHDGLPGPEAEALLAEPGALAWIRSTRFLEDLKKFEDAEARLRRFGL